MSEGQNAAAAASKKKKSASRWSKGKKGGKDTKSQSGSSSKRKRDLDDVADLPEGAEGENDEQEIEAFVKANNEAGAKKRKADADGDVEMKTVEGGGEEGEKKKKKRRKKKVEGAEDKVRFLTFVGNLPYNITHDQLQKHFASVNPTSIRLQTDKETKKPKGFAFVEFGSYTDMEKCLTGFHHTQLGDRKINVELTVGGGGNKSKDRRMKITMKNEKLNEERKKLGEKRKEKGESKKEGEPEQNFVSMDGVHPSRRARVGQV